VFIYPARLHVFWGWNLPLMHFGNLHCSVSRVNHNINWVILLASESYWLEILYLFWKRKPSLLDIYKTSGLRIMFFFFFLQCWESNPGPCAC
jgi:hypothetical protein